LVPDIFINARQPKAWLCVKRNIGDKKDGGDWITRSVYWSEFNPSVDFRNQHLCCYKLAFLSQ